MVKLAPYEYDPENGLKVKYRVYKVRNGEPVENCFVLRPDKDKAALEALRRYSEVTENTQLRDDLRHWISWMEDEIYGPCYRCRFGTSPCNSPVLCVDFSEYEAAMEGGKGE